MKDKRCKCSMSISVLGDGCRYCQPQEYIDRLEGWLEEERAETVEQVCDHIDLIYGYDQSKIPVINAIRAKFNSGE